MKNYKDMADAVFARRDEYVASVKRKKKIAFNAGLSLCTICLAVLGAFGIWKSGVLTPDPNVIGTKPHSYTETTEVTLSGNATNQGEYSDTAEHITGNSKPQSTTGNSVNPTEGSKPQPTDPAEKPDTPVVKPTLPILPTLPIGPNPPNYPNVPDVPPTSGDTQHPKPTVPSVIFTDPVVTEPTEGNPKPDLPITSPDKPQTGPGRPPIVIPDVTMPQEPSTDSTARPDEPEYNPPEWTAATEPVETEPCWTEPNEPNDAPCTPETQAPMEPTEPTNAPVVEPTVPVATEALENVVEGVVVDQYGNPVKGAVVTVYSRGMSVKTYTTNSNGYYYMSDFRNSDTSIAVTSLPSGYTASATRINFYGSYNYIVLTCNKI